MVLIEEVMPDNQRCIQVWNAVREREGMKYQNSIAWFSIAQRTLSYAANVTENQCREW